MELKEKIEYLKRKIKSDPANPELHFSLGKLCSENCLWDEAINSFQKSIELDSHHIQSYLELSNLLFSLDKIDKAVEVCQLGIEYNTESSAIYYLLEQLYEILGEYELAHQTLEDLLNVDDGFTKAYEALGRLAIMQNNFDEAQTWLEKLIIIDPDNINAYVYLANIYRRRKQFDKAISYLQTALKKDPNNLDIFNDLGLVYLESDELQKAKEHFEYVISLDESYSFAFDNLGVIYRKLQLYPQAEEVLKKSLSRNLQAWTYNELALVYTEMGKYKDSIDCSKKALAIDENYMYAYDNLGAVYRKVGYYDKAEQALLKSIELKPDDSWTYNQLGLLYFERGIYISAKANFTKSIELDYKHYWPKINLASCYMKEKEYQLAKNYLEELAKKYPDNPRVFLLQSKLFYLFEQYSGAIELANTAIEKDPEDALAIANLGVIYREMKDYEQAQIYFEKAIDSPRPKDSSVYLEYAMLNIFTKEYDKAFNNCIIAHQLDELNYNIYCLMAIIDKSSTLETKFMNYLKETDQKFKDQKEILLSYASTFLELGLPEESEKYFSLALRIDNTYKEAQYGLAQTYYIMNMYDKSLEYSFYNTDNTENVEISSYSNALVALSYKASGDLDKFEKHRNEAFKLNITIEKEFQQKYQIREALKFKPRIEFFSSMMEMFKDLKADFTLE